MNNDTSGYGLIDLINHHKRVTSVAEIVRNSGGKMTAPRIYSMLSRGVIKAFPDVDTIEGLAAGMRIPVAEVVLAAARSLGIRAETPASSSPDDLVLFGGGKLSGEVQIYIQQGVRLAMQLEGIDADASEVDAEPEPDWNDLALAAEDKREPGHDARFAASLGDDGEGSQEDPRQRP